MLNQNISDHLKFILLYIISLLQENIPNTSYSHLNHLITWVRSGIKRTGNGRRHVRKALELCPSNVTHE